MWLSYIELDQMLRDTSPATARERIEHAMDSCRAAGFNAVFFHLRAHDDAYFPSQVWPAANSAAMVMAQGFDPLACAVEAAHRNGLQLHGWLNPYRIGTSPATGATTFQKGDVWYYAPSDPAARRRILDGAQEILEHYAVDGIHFDDYFYPTGMAPDGEPFETIPPHTDVTLWRQTQVDTLIRGIYELCHRYGNVFGVSPIADLQRGRTEAYADAARWMRDDGYVDYVCPQLYTGFRHQSHPFPSLLTQWSSLPRREDVRLYIGLALYKVGMSHDPYAGTGSAEWAEDEDILARQIALAETSADGYVLFRYDFINNG